jgi:hypothetical protein
MVHGTNNSKGAAILLGHKLDYQIKEKVIDRVTTALTNSPYVLHVVHFEIRPLCRLTYLASR